MPSRDMVAVTGGGTGIGRAVVLAFAAAGFDVATCARSKDDLASLADELRTVSPSTRLLTTVTDVATRSGARAFSESVTNDPAPLKVLVSNAGGFVPGTVSEEPDDALEHMIATNLYSAYWVTRAVMPKLIAHSPAHIFTICSTASIEPYPSGASYCISKHALLGFTRVLREDLRPHNVRVTAVIPGATYTRSWHGTSIPLERFMQPADVADAILSAHRLPARTAVEELVLRPTTGNV